MGRLAARFAKARSADGHVLDFDSKGCPRRIPEDRPRSLLAWEIIKDRPFLNDELRFRTPLKTVLGYSSGAIPTILTGLAPAETGHWNQFFYDPKRSPFRRLRWLSNLPDRLLDNRVSRKLITEFGRRILGMGPLFGCSVNPALLPFLDWVEKRNIYAE